MASVQRTCPSHTVKAPQEGILPADIADLFDRLACIDGRERNILKRLAAGQTLRPIGERVGVSGCRVGAAETQLYPDGDVVQASVFAGVVGADADLLCGLLLRIAEEDPDVISGVGRVRRPDADALLGEVLG